MNKIAQKIVDILLEKNFLNKKRKEEYVYVVEILLEKYNFTWYTANLISSI